MTSFLPFPNIDPIALHLGPLVIRWYALAYVGGILLGYALIVRLLRLSAPPPMSKRHAEEFITWSVLAIILGGRLAYVLFYDLPRFIAHPASIVQLWQGGMSFHGGLAGMCIAMALFARYYRLNPWRVADIVACAAPIGLGFGRLTNFINGELYGRVTSLPWGMIFPRGGPLPRHPSQLYEALLEGPVLLAIVLIAYTLTPARRWPGFVAGLFGLCYGLFRFAVEFVREPDDQLGFIAAWATMGQLLSVPMILLGTLMMLTARRRAVPGQEQAHV